MGVHHVHIPLGIPRALMASVHLIVAAVVVASVAPTTLALIATCRTRNLQCQVAPARREHWAARSAQMKGPHISVAREAIVTQTRGSWRGAVCVPSAALA
eukprot:scaffold1343_cov369-Prasinococcus_capsulatus_cf.AAC.9